MTDRTDFEARLESRLRARAAVAARPFDAAAIVRDALAPQRNSGAIALRWVSLPRGLRWSLAALAVAGSLLGTLAIGGPLIEQSRRPATIINDWIVFKVQGFERVSDSDIWIGRLGSSDRRLIGSDEFAEGCPSFSPDGTLLAYSASLVGMGDSSGDVVVVGFDASNGQVGDELMAAPTSGSGCPNWSPDGRSFAYESSGRIWHIGLDGSSAELFSSPDTGEHSTFDWSPDGTQIAVIAGSTLTVVPVNGGERRVVLQEPEDVELYHATWSPDGARIAVEAVRHIPIVGGNVMEELPVRIVAAAGKAAPIELAETDVDSPAWSPDGQRLAYHRTLDDRGARLGEIVVTAFDGREPLVLASNTSYVRGVTWAPDASLVLYITDGGVWTVSASGDSAPVALNWKHWFEYTSENDLSWYPGFVRE